MTWPGTFAPPTRPRRRRRGTGKPRRKYNGPSATERLVTKIARRLGVAGKAKRTTEGWGRCLPHCYAELGFSSPWAAAAYLDELARRRPGAKTLRLPREKRPEGVRRVLAVRCPGCRGRGCPACEQFGWGVRFVVGIPATRCARHEAA